jgi:peptidoglycan/LPS O-acetylase OafA/YrhL
MATAGKTNRFMELEGLRVIVAVVVVLYHAALIFYPGFFYGIGTTLAPVQNMRFEDNIYQNPLSGLLSGVLAVGIFFVLSGFVLSIGYFQRKDPAVIEKLASKRYLRLMLPAAASVMIAWIAIRLGATHQMAEVASVTHSGWLSQLWLVPPHFFSAIWQGVVASFTIGEVYYNPVLWTIQYELIGSFIVFGVMYAFSSSRYRWVVYGVLLYTFAGSWLLGFITGMVLADLYAHRKGIFEALDRKATYVLLLIGIIIGGYPSGPVTSALYKLMTIPQYTLVQQLSFCMTIGATLIVLSVLSLSAIKSILAHPRISGLGKYTYSLYLVHMPVLFTVCTSVFLLVLPIGFHKASLVAIAAVVVVLPPIVYLFERYVDSPSLLFAGYCAEVYRSGRPVLLGQLIARNARKVEAFMGLGHKKRRVTEIDMETE